MKNGDIQIDYHVLSRLIKDGLLKHHKNFFIGALLLRDTANTFDQKQWDAKLDVFLDSMTYNIVTNLKNHIGNKLIITEENDLTGNIDEIMQDMHNVKDKPFKGQFCSVKIDICSANEIVEPNPNPQILDTAVWYQDSQFWVDSSKFINISGKTYLKGEIITLEDEDTAECRLDCRNDITVWVRLWGSSILIE